jgi:iron(III) transport system ATP-binding protein
MTALSAHGLRKRFGSTTVLSDLSMVVPEGAIMAVLGPSGCGKTTLLRILAGFLDPDAGTVRFGDRTVVGQGRAVSPQQRKVGYVPQEGALFPHRDVAANIMFGLRRSRRTVQKLHEMLDLIELPYGAAQMRPHELSGGQQQRVALARALAPEPAVVLLDEPFSSLDAGLREGTGRAVVHALRAAGATAVLVTHDQSEALSLADLVAVMRQGGLAQVGAPTEIYRSPVDAGVATFVGGAALLPAQVRSGIAACALGEVLVRDGVPLGAGQVLIRPEQIRIHSIPAQSDGPMEVSAVVTEVSFYGHDAAVHLSLLPDGPAVIARQLGSDVPPPGAKVWLTVEGEASVFAPGSEPASQRPKPRPTA